ncbi:amphi-Trp domain-containing protein [Halopiger aswanensis]|uniref:Amphi-Trp domain-containing protein n=1 Tax=Halopiger aswanensis TaxID=148449 RepID=A0A3R7KKU0_9EURY|nr:amphi-Trp domain-containing protein [Halopiger aswanensis]RKD95054.1 amphi-Trp domain-containing protein [Halopiger aswanensis]
MVETVSAEKLDREEAAEQLRELADELENGDESTVRAGNKTVALRPPSSIAYEVSVRERSSILRGQRESVTIKMDWRPSNVSEAGDTAGAEAE